LFFAFISASNWACSSFLAASPRVAGSTPAAFSQDSKFTASPSRCAATTADVFWSAPIGTNDTSPSTVFRATMTGPSNVRPLTFTDCPASTYSRAWTLQPIEHCHGKPLAARAETSWAATPTPDMTPATFSRWAVTSTLSVCPTICSASCCFRIGFVCRRTVSPSRSTTTGHPYPTFMAPPV
jgi:hypothetical protein